MRENISPFVFGGLLRFSLLFLAMPQLGMLHTKQLMSLLVKLFLDCTISGSSWANCIIKSSFHIFKTTFPNQGDPCAKEKSFVSKLSCSRLLICKEILFSQRRIQTCSFSNSTPILTQPPLQSGVQLQF